MKAIAIFIASAVLAIIAALALLGHIIPPGEGSFGMAKLAPVILIILIPVCFCLIWFPVNMAVWLLLTRDQKNKATRAKQILVSSGKLFALMLVVLGSVLGLQWIDRVHLYYKLEDQFGQPVSGATIRRHEDFSSAAGDTETQSDAQGLFKESCKPGESFSLSPRKKGYALASLNGRGTYTEDLRQKQKLAHGLHDLIVIKMWKLQGAQPVVRINQHYKLHYTNSTINFDLLEGTVVPNGGDIKITMSRSPGVVSERTLKEWAVKVEAVDGGVFESGGQEAVTYAAPEVGYQQSLTFTFSTNMPNKWLGSFNQGLFVKSRNGQVYSKLGLSFQINSDPNGFMYISFGGIASTNGSRNWEGDPNTFNGQQ